MNIRSLEEEEVYFHQIQIQSLIQNQNLILNLIQNQSQKNRLKDFHFLGLLLILHQLDWCIRQLGILSSRLASILLNCKLESNMYFFELLRKQYRRHNQRYHF
jgi:hypothetical protein